MRRTREIGAEADKLASALRNENKVQGNWGELILDELLESQGLKEGIHYEKQVTLRDRAGKAILNEESGKRMIPDTALSRRKRCGNRLQGVAYGFCGLSERRDGRRACRSPTAACQERTAACGRIGPQGLQCVHQVAASGFELRHHVRTQRRGAPVGVGRSTGVVA